MTEQYPLLAKDVADAKRIRVNGGRYLFHVFSVGERSAQLSPALIREVRDGLVSEIRALDVPFDYVVAVERTGLHWASLVALELEKTVAILRERSSGLKGETKIHQEGILYNRDLFLRGFKRGDRVIIVDDVVSSGNTAKTIIDALAKERVLTVGVFCIVAKGDGWGAVQEDADVPVSFLHHVSLT